MNNTVNSDLAAEINRINSIIGNRTIASEHFINLTNKTGNDFEGVGSTHGSCSYVFNLTDSPVAYSRRDGVVTPVAPLNNSSIYHWLKEKYHNCVLVIESRMVDLELFDPDIGRVFGQERNCNAEASESFCIFEDNITPDGRQQFPYQRDMENVIRHHFRLLRHKDHFDLNREDRDFLADNRQELTVKCMTAYLIDAEAFKEEADIYVPHIDMVFRKLQQVTAFRKVKNKEIVYSKLDTLHSTPLKHPLINVDTISMIRGVNQALANHTYVGLIRVQYWRNRSDSKVVFLIRNKEIIELDLKLVDNKLEEGIYITEKNASGQIIETKHDIADAEKYDLYWKYEDAISANTLYEREREAVEAKIKSEEDKIKAEKAEAEAKQRTSEEKMREADASKVKGEMNNKSDVLKLIGQVVTVIAAVATAVVTLVKLFSPSRFIGSLLREVA